MAGTRAGLKVYFVDAAAEMTNFPSRFSCTSWRSLAICPLGSHQAKGAQQKGKEALISFLEMKEEFKNWTLSEAKTKSQNIARYCLKLNISQMF